MGDWFCCFWLLEAAYGFELATPMQLNSCLGKNWEGVSARRELQTVIISGTFDQKLVILLFGAVFLLKSDLFNKYKYKLSILTY